MVRVVISFADDVSTSFMNRGWYVRSATLAGLRAPVRVEYRCRALGLYAISGIGELRYGACGIVTVRHTSWRYADETSRLLFPWRVVALRRRGLLLVRRTVVGLLRIAGRAWRRLGHPARRRCLLHPLSSTERVLLLLVVVANEEENSKADERKTAYTANNTTDNGPDGS